MVVLTVLTRDVYGVGLPTKEDEATQIAQRTQALVFHDNETIRGRIRREDKTISFIAHFAHSEIEIELPDSKVRIRIVVAGDSDVPGNLERSILSGYS